jgi:hypothetical protein
MLLTLSNCASIPNVVPPDPMHIDEEGQVRHFEGATMDQVLAAAEAVLRKHRPEGRFIRERDSVVMEYEWWIFFGIIAGYDQERWVVVSREIGGITAASVAMGRASDGYFGPFAMGKEYPQAATWWKRREIHVDYGTFWKRVRSLLANDPWPECDRLRMENHYRYYEPLCGHETVDRSDTD